MSIYHCTIKMHGQSSGRSCMAKIAYRAGDNLRDPETGKKYNFKNKSSVVFSDIKLPECAPSEWNDRQTLWAEVMKKENESNSQYMREIQPAWPNEWSNEDCIAATKKMADWLCNTYNIPVDYSYEDKHTINPKTMEEIINKHSHICMPTRQLDENGEWLKFKQKKEYALDENGERIPVIDPATGEQKLDARNRKQWKRTIVYSNPMDNRDNAELWRSKVADIINEKNAELKLDKVDHRSYERQGINRIPQVKEGYAARQIEARGGISEKCETNRQIAVINKAIEATEINAEATKKQIEAEARVAYNEETRKGKAAGDKYNKTLQKVYALYNNSTERLPAPFKTGFDNVDEYLDKIYAAHVKRTPEPARGTVRVISAAERQSWYEIGKLAGFPPAEIDRLFDVERFKPFSEKQLAYQSIKASREQFWREWKKKKAEIDRETNRAYKGRSKLRKAEWILHSKSPSWGQIIYAVIVLAKNRNAERDIELLKEVRDELYSDMREFKATTGATKSLLRDRDIRLDGYIEALRAAENKADRIYEQAEQEEKQNGYSALDELVRRAEAKKKPEQTNRPDKNKDHNLTY